MTEPAIPPIFFLHNPKAAGTSIKFRLDRSFEPQEISPTIEALPRDRDPTSWDNYDHYKFISGHCGYETYQAIGAGHLLITNFRHPVSRIVSLYDYWRNNFRDDEPAKGVALNAPHFARGMSFADFIRTDEPIVRLYVRNAHARQLLETAWRYWEPEQSNLLTLKRRIDAMHWYYLCEQPELSELWFKAQFPQIPPGPFAVENVTLCSQQPKTEPSPEDIAVICQFNYFDLEIYNYAANLIRNRASASPSR